MLNFSITAISSNSGKTLLTMALLDYFKSSVRPFKIGPDYIDPQFHKKISNSDSINLDTFLMNEEQVKWLYSKYSNKRVSILEGVMGFYDGEDRGCSTYSITKLLNIPTILILDCRGTYITISALLKGILEYRRDNTIKAVVLNYISSESHYNLIKNILEKEHNIIVLGWIKKNIPILKNTHLGLDLENINKIEKISREVLKNINLSLLKAFAKREKKLKIDKYPFEKIEKQDKHLTIVNDKNFSFLYYDNLQFLKEIFKKVTIVNSIRDEPIPKKSDIVYICGGYVESREAYNRIKNSNNFRKSLINHSKNRKIYAECAGLLYLGNRVDDKKMSGILDIDFTLTDRFIRLGYYYNEKGVKGHSFHYTKPIDNKNGFDILSKRLNGEGEVGSWQNLNGKVFGTYLHTMFRNNIKLLKERFL